MGLINLLLNPWVIFLALVIVTIVITIILTITERVLNKRILIVKTNQEKTPASNIRVLLASHMNPTIKLKKLDLVAKDIFQRFFNLNTQKSYYDLAMYFQKQNKQVAYNFCYQMSNLFYSGEELKEEKINDMLILLGKVYQEAREENKIQMSQNKLQDSMQLPQPPNINFKKILNAEDRIVQKLAQPKPQNKTLSKSTTQKIQPKPLPKSQTVAVPQKKGIQKIYQTKRDRLKNTPLMKLFGSLKSSPKQITTKPTQKSPQQMVQKPIVQKIEQPNTENQKKINELQKKVLEKQKLIEELLTRKQIKNIQESSRKFDVNSKEKKRPLIQVRPTLKNSRLSKRLSRKFQETNKEIKELEKNIIDKERNMGMNPPQQNRVDLQNIRKSEHIKEPTYNEPKVVVPRRQKIVPTSNIKNKLKKDEFIHNIDSLERLRQRVKEHEKEFHQKN